MQETLMILIMDPEVNRNNRMTATYAVVNLADPIDARLDKAAVEHDLSVLDKNTLAMRKVISPVFQSGDQYFVKTASGYSRLQEWIQ